MLPNVTLRAVTRDDVDNVGWWLEDEDVSSRWFGHYGCGDPVHRGYDPQHMLESSDWEWQSVFGDPHRMIFSIYSDMNEHVGECQVLRLPQFIQARDTLELGGRFGQTFQLRHQVAERDAPSTLDLRGDDPRTERDFEVGGAVQRDQQAEDRELATRG